MILGPKSRAGGIVSSGTLNKKNKKNKNMVPLTSKQYTKTHSLISEDFASDVLF